MNYRVFREDDFTQLYAIELACFQPQFRFSRNTMRTLIADPSSATWVAEEQEQLAGFAIVFWSQPPEQPLAYIQTLEVALAHRNRGIAGKLLRLLEESAKSAGAHVIWLHVAETNAPAIRLYQAHGYSQQGREENYYTQGTAALLYAKPIE
jgi:ribosomal protein S18 acetylase RimI-like enzyme